MFAILMPLINANLLDKPGSNNTTSPVYLPYFSLLSTEDDEIVD